MAKEFNVTGTCFPHRHYMADISAKFKTAINLVKKGKYFSINRPRQYGKTTMLYRLSDVLRASDEYIVFNTSFEGLGDSIFNDEKSFSSGFVSVLARYSTAYAPHLTNWIKEQQPEIDSFGLLSDFITAMVVKSDKKIVLLIDEVDKSSNNQIFINFLAMLRNKYLERETFPTFHAVVLAGLYDVKTLKLKLRPDAEQKFNSPWNIAADFKVDMNLQAAEIKPMLDEYCSDNGVTMDTQAMAEQLFYHTSGYPFLVSKLCKTIDEEILPEKTEKTWTRDDLNTALRELGKEKNTNFDTLIKNLENNPDLYRFVYRMIIDSDIIYYNTDDPLIELGILHGIFKQNGHITIHNRIYEQRIYDYMTSKTITTMKSNLVRTGHFTSDDGGLDMSAVLLKFQQFMKEEFSEKDQSFLEQNGRLVFLSFLSPVLNGKGQALKEVQISEEKRLDVVATYNQYRYIIELKRWYGEVYHQKGIKQLNDYLDVKAENTGYLVIFEYNTTKSWRKEWIEYNGKRIFAVWV